jgi:hypothetical protein
MYYRDTTEGDIRRGVEAFVAVETALRIAKLHTQFYPDFEPDCAETVVRGPDDHGIISIMPQEDDTGYEVAVPGRRPEVAWTAMHAARKAVAAVFDWKLQRLPVLVPDEGEVEEMFEQVMESLAFLNETGLRFNEAGRPD